MYPQILQRSKLPFRLVILLVLHAMFVFGLTAQTCTVLAIPENGCGSGMNLLVPITINSAPGTSLGSDVFLDKVDIIIDHHFSHNLDIYLMSPSGVEIELSSDNGSTYDYGNPTTCPNNPTTFANWATTNITDGNSPFIGNYLPEGSFSAFNGSNPNGVWTLRMCDDSPISQGNFIYFNVSFTTCLRPVGLVSSNPTINGATLNWTALGPATTWDIEFQPTGTAQTGTPTVTGVTSNPYTWTGGAPGKIYRAWVRSNCGGSVSEWIGPTTFTTKIDNAVQTCMALPIPDNGCNSNYLQVPLVVSGAPGSSLGTDVFIDRVELIIQHNLDFELSISLQSPGGAEIDLSSENGGGGDHYGNPGNCPNQVTAFAPWASGSITAGAAPFIGTYLPEGNFSVFNGVNPNGEWLLKVCDDINGLSGSLIYVKIFFTVCPRPTALAASTPNVNGATLNWTENGNATAWDFEFQPVGTPATGVPTVTGATSKPYVWTGGSPFTNYQAWVRSNCGGSVSGWTGPVTFVTHLSNSAPVCASAAIPDPGCLILPLTVSGVTGNTLGTDIFLDKVELIVQHPRDSDVDIYLRSPNGTEIDLSSDNGGSGDHYGNPAACPTQVTSFATWANTSITAGTAPYIGTYLPEVPFSSLNGSAANGDWFFSVCDDASGSPGSFIYAKLFFTTCPRPGSLVSSNPTLHGATIDWTENGAATSWDMEFQPLGSAQTGIPNVTGTSSKPYTWTSGASFTNYQVWVRSNCGGSVSEWIGPVTFLTTIDNAAQPCLSLPIPDNGCVVLPVTVSGAPGNTLGTDVHLEKVDLIVQHVRDADLDISLQSPNGTEIDLTSDNGSFGDHYGNPAACPSQVTSFASWAGSSITAGAPPYIGNYMPEGSFSSLNGSNANGNWTLRVCDDASSNAGSFVYTKLHFTSCLRPVGFNITGVTKNGATFDWTEMGAATTWDLEFQPVGTAPTGMPTVSGTTSKPYTWTGGQQATNYQAWVRSNCGGSVSEWNGPVAFLTHLDNAAPVCVAFNIPDGGCFGSGTNSFQMPISVSGAPGTTLGSDVFLNRVDLIIQHGFNFNVGIGLISPSGVEINLCDGNGSSGDNFGNPAACPTQVTTFDTWAATSITAGSAPFIGSYQPETPFATFDGENPNGTWILNVCDELNGNTGNFRYVKLHFSTILPVELTTFTATPVGEKTVRLQWTTASEQNSARFEVERSANGQDFYTIASKAAAGNSTNKHDYELSDLNPLPGENYYRLRQIDVDGKFGYSPIRLAVIRADALENKWNVYPNPAHSSFFVENREREGVVWLFDIAGKQVLEQTLSVGNQRTEINAERLPAGVYGLKIQTENGVFVSKVVIERG